MNEQTNFELQRIANVLEEILGEMKKEKEPIKKPVSRIPYKPVRIPYYVPKVVLPSVRYPPKQKQKLEGTGEIKK